MTKEFKFYGSSDDLFSVDVNGAAYEEIYPPEQYMLTGPNGERMVVNAVYAAGNRAGVWNIGVEQFDEDWSLPSWPVRFETSERGYSAVLVVDAPDDTLLEIINRSDD